MQGYFNFFSTLAWALAFILAAFSFSKSNYKLQITNYKFYYGLLALGILTRLLYLALAAPRGPELIDGFYERAVGLYQGKGLLNWGGGLTALWMPGVSLLYAAAFHLFGGPGNSSIYLVQTFLGFVMIAIAYLYASLLFNRTTGILAAGLLSLFPSQIILETFALSDLAFQVALWGGAAAYAWARRLKSGSGSRALFVLSGLCFGFSVITRPYGLFIALVYLGWHLVKSLELKREIVRIMPVVFLILVFWGGWIIRNERVFHRFVPFTTTGGINLWVANHPGASGKLEYLAGAHPFLTYLSTPEEELNLDQRLKIEAMSYIRNHPGIFLRQIPKKWMMLFESDTTYLGMVLSYRFQVTNAWIKNFLGGIANGYYLTFLIASFWFCIRKRKLVFSNPDHGFGVLMFFSLLAVFVVFHIETRFHIPLVPALCIYGAAHVAESTET